MVTEHEPAVAEYQHDKHRHREADALHMLRKIASLVKPIMRQRRWRVGMLTEFYPEERNLLGLNINRGERICLRLRHAGDERQFLPIEQVTDTMLHELCHIVHGPHDEHFHALWSQLRDEHENLARKGYTGEGFLSQGHKLGGGRIPIHEARRRARAAAEKRQTLSAGSGQRLGGMPVRRGQDIRQVIADAAQRRTTVLKGCASGHTTKAKEREIIDLTDKRGVRTKAPTDNEDEEAIMLAYIDLVQEEEKSKYGDAYVPPSAQNPAGNRGHEVGRRAAEEIATSELAQIQSSRSRPDPKPRVPAETKPKQSVSSSSKTSSTKVDLTNPALYPVADSWACEICTLINPPTHLICDACANDKPSPPATPTSQAANTTASRGLPDRNKPSMLDSNTTKAIRTLREMESREKQKPKAPLGWLCQDCGQFMEREWWTCGNCGAMKTSS